MSGESRRTIAQSYGLRVRPEPVIDKSFVENVAGFINEIVPQTNQNPSHYEGKERIQWVRFDNCDINDFALFRDTIESNGNAPPFLLIIGYDNGVQAWVIPSNGEAVEVFSYRQGPVRSLKVLPTPITSNRCVDQFSLKRPLFAICDSASPGPPFHSVAFISFKTADPIKTIKFSSAVQDIHANKKVIVLSFVEKLAIFDSATLNDLFTVNSCYPCPGPSLNPIALGDLWLAYAERKLHSIHQSCGGVVTEGVPSYKSTVLHAAKSLTKGLKELGETVASNLMGSQKPGGMPGNMQQPQNIQSTISGVITIINTNKVKSNDVKQVTLTNADAPYIISHFVAHSAPIVAMQFDPSGMLLATADKPGHVFHVFRINPHPISSSQAAVHHIYSLHRGDTTAKVMDITFSLDSRWVTFSTHRGTTHVYPITPYGGSIGVRTHQSVCVVNKMSRFKRSAGLEDQLSGRNSPILSVSPAGTKHMHGTKFSYEPSPNMAYHNPRYPPYPTPTVIRPLAQLRQPLLQNLLETITLCPSPSHSPPTSKSSRVAGPEEIVRVCSTFGTSRGWLAGSPTILRESKQRCIDSLFVMAYHGNLIEYYIQPRVASLVPSDKISTESPIELEVHAIAQWSLIRESTSNDLRAPLPKDSLLLCPQFNEETEAPSPIDDDPEERWMSQVEIHTHSGPPRRLWMGPQFTFKPFPGTRQHSTDDSSIDTDPSLLILPNRSSPVDMPGITGPNMPVLIEAGSLTSIPSPLPRPESFSSGGDPAEPLMNRLKCELADAMNDIPVVKRKHEGGSQNVSESDSTLDDIGFDFSDVMDISCDPPGPCSIGSRGPTPSHKIGSQEEICGVTAKLRQVAITSCSPPVSSQPYFTGSRTPSLEECKGLTSSAEELAFTLEGKRYESRGPSNLAWSPVDSPISKPVTSQSSQKQVEKVKKESKKEKRGNKKEEVILETTDTAMCWTDLSLNTVEDDINFTVRDKVLPPQYMTKVCSADNPVEKPSFRKVSTEILPEVKPEIKQPQFPIDAEFVDEPYPPMGSSTVVTSGTLASSSGAVSSKSATTSDDDQFMVREVRQKDKHKKKKKKKEEIIPTECEVKEEVKKKPLVFSAPDPVEAEPFPEPYSVPVASCWAKPTYDAFEDTMVPVQDVPTYETDPSNQYVEYTEYPDYTQENLYPEHYDQSYEAYGYPTYPTTQDELAEITDIYDYPPISSDPYLDTYVPPPSPPSIDIENEQFHTAAEDFHDPIEEDFNPQTPDDIEILDAERERVRQEILLSIHSEEDLAKALEEASSDESSIVKTKLAISGDSKGPDEMFPFRDTSSDDERLDGEQRIRRRGGGSRIVVNPRSVQSEQDDDCTTTSGDEKRTTSESDVTNSPNPRGTNGKGKKKKKKKK